jgi:SPP1 gp7 family putative phage head morphogenesis protein
MCVNCQLEHIVQMSAVNDLDRRFEELARRIYSSDGWSGSVDQEAIELIARELVRGLEIGFGGSANDVGIESTRFRTMQFMTRNVFVFSGFKTHRQLSEISQLLFDDEGNIVPFNSFLQAVKRINSTYNTHYLNAEYNHAVASSQMAVNWQDYMDNIDVAPFLKYVTAGDERVREEHRGLDGTIKRKDDPFWRTWYPPNGWNCRCDVIELVSSELGEVEPAFLPDKQPLMFKNNVGIDGVVFPDSHPYFTGLKPQDVRLINRAVDNAIPPVWGETTGSVERKKAVLNYGRSFLVGSTRKVGPITPEVTWQGLQHIVNFRSPYPEFKLKAASEIDILLERSIYDRFQPDKDQRPGVGFHYLLSYYGDFDVEIVIKQTPDKYSVYDLTLKKKTPQQ